MSDSLGAQTLAQAGMQRIQLKSRATGTSFGNAILTQSCHLTRNHDSVDEAGSFNYAQERSARELERLALSDTAEWLSCIAANGWTRHLQEVATMRRTVVIETRPLEL